MDKHDVDGNIECLQSQVDFNIQVQDVSLSETTVMNYCRLCALLSADAVSIFEEEGMNMKLAYKINKHLPILVTQGNKLPLHVCRKCIAQLDATVNFINKCVQAQFKVERIFQGKEGIDSDGLTVVFNKVNVAADGPITLSKSNERTESVEVSVPSKDDGRRDSGSAGGPGSTGSSERVGNGQPLGVSAPASVQKITLVELSDDDDAGENMDSAGTAAEPEDEAVTNRGDVAEQAVDGEAESTNALSKTDSSISTAQCKYFCQYCNSGFKWKAELFCHQTSAHPDLVFRCYHCLKIFYECKDEYLKHEEAHMSVSANGKSEKRNSLSTPANANKVNDAGGLSCERGGEIVDLATTDTTQQWIKDILSGDETRKVYGRWARLPPPRSGSVGAEKESGKKSCSRASSDGNALQALVRFCVGEGEPSEAVSSSTADPDKQREAFKCKWCDMRFKTKVERSKHLRVNHRLRLPCRFCPRTMNKQCELEKHEAKHFSKSKRRCRKCGESFDTVETLNEHKKSHPSDRPHVCQFCQKSYQRRAELKSHLIMHSEERPFLCEKCGKNFKTSSNLSLHRRFYCGNPETAKKFVCDVCQKRFNCRSRLLVHERVHTGEKPYTCSTCGKSFHSNTTLNLHMRTHSDVRYPCPHCNAVFKRKDRMVRHRKRHERVECETCGEAFDGVQLLLRHRKSHEADGGGAPIDGRGDPAAAGFPCGECGKLLPSSASLISHAATHSDEWPYECTVCEKRLRNKVTLKKHMEMHSGGRPHHCRHCSRTFMLYQSMVEHEKVHSAVKPYSCAECGKSFQTAVGLSNHLLDHSAGNAFPCDVCGKSFARKVSLLIHRRNHAPKDLYACSFCPRTFSLQKLAGIHERSHLTEHKDASIIPIVVVQDIVPSIPVPNKESHAMSSIADNSAGEVLVYDSLFINSHYSETITVSDKVDELDVVGSERM